MTKKCIDLLRKLYVGRLIVRRMAAEYGFERMIWVEGRAVMRLPKESGRNGWMRMVLRMGTERP